MIQYALVCVLWALPDAKNVQVNVDEYGLATLNETLGDFTFEASVMEEKINYLQITFNPAQVVSQTYGSALRLNMGAQQASFDCEIKE